MKKRSASPTVSDETAPPPSKKKIAKSSITTRSIFEVSDIVAKIGTFLDIPSLLNFRAVSRTVSQQLDEVAVIKVCSDAPNCKGKCESFEELTLKDIIERNDPYTLGRDWTKMLSDFYKNKKSDTVIDLKQMCNTVRYRVQFLESLFELCNALPSDLPLQEFKRVQFLLKTISIIYYNDVPPASCRFTFHTPEGIFILVQMQSPSHMNINILNFGHNHDDYLIENLYDESSAIPSPIGLSGKTFLCMMNIICPAEDDEEANEGD